MPKKKKAAKCAKRKPLGRLPACPPACLAVPANNTLLLQESLRLGQEEGQGQQQQEQEQARDGAGGVYAG
jgi:hypothetical protein